MTTEPSDLVFAMPASGTGRDCLETDRLPWSIGQLAGLDQSKNLATTAVRREAEEDWGR